MLNSKPMERRSVTDKYTPSPQAHLAASKAGQVVVEYVMILTLVVAVLALTKIKITATGSLDLSGQATGSMTIMEKLSESFTVWVRDMFIIVSLPS